MCVYALVCVLFFKVEVYCAISGEIEDEGCEQCLRRRRNHLEAQRSWTIAHLPDVRESRPRGDPPLLRVPIPMMDKKILQNLCKEGKT